MKNCNFRSAQCGRADTRTYLKDFQVVSRGILSAVSSPSSLHLHASLRQLADASLICPISTSNLTPPAPPHRFDTEQHLSKTNHAVMSGEREVKVICRSEVDKHRMHKIVPRNLNQTRPNATSQSRV
ncbi:hypothetical protein JOB18_031176 [Solea senegalensis]|uniref:Uncharacterized protein n=1 Tax=Solea senegalensis TaxID=28829 RepID=A0AAV6QN80_SOLSE|nr:hypothetical protein JOB18_031176 [Solea senegalensis]